MGADVLQEGLRGRLLKMPGALGSMADSEIAALAEAFSPKTYAKETPLLRQGEVWGEAFFIERGLVRLYFVTLSGQAFNKNFFAEGALFFPVTPMTRNEPSLFYIETLEESRIHVAPFARFEAALRDVGAWERTVLPFCEVLADQKISREFAFLMHDAKTRYLAFLRDHSALAARLPDYHLASYLGVTNVTLSRIKREMREEGDV